MKNQTEDFTWEKDVIAACVPTNFNKVSRKVDLPSAAPPPCRMNRPTGNEVSHHKCCENAKQKINFTVVLIV